MSKTVLITGAGSGFGRGAAVELAARGHRVIATTYTEHEAREMSGAHPELEVVKLDITEQDDIGTLDNWEIDVLINNAGYGQTGPLARVPMHLVRRTFEVNVFGTLAVTQRVVAQMKRRGSGRILIVSSIAGVSAGAGSGPYAMSKHALQAMGSTLRLELAPLGIDVALINPGPFATGFNDKMVDDPGDWFDITTASPEEIAFMKALKQRITVGQLDPNGVSQKYADLAEADTTELINFVPTDILERPSN